MTRSNFIILGGLLLVISAAASFLIARFIGDGSLPNGTRSKDEAGHISEYRVGLPSRESKWFIADDEELKVALEGAEQGDIEYMDGLRLWYGERGDKEKSDHWEKRGDAERQKRGLPSRIESMKFTKGVYRNDFVGTDFLGQLSAILKSTMMGLNRVPFGTDTLYSC